MPSACPPRRGTVNSYQQYRTTRIVRTRVATRVTTEGSGDPCHTSGNVDGCSQLSEVVAMWETLQESWGSLLEPLHDPVTLAIPAFLTFLILEWIAARTLEHVEPGPDGRTRPPRGGYEKRDARASISMGLVSIVTSAAWKVLALVGYSALWVYVAPWHLPADAWYTWVIL